MSIADTASKLLKQFGEPIQFSYISGGSYDPATGGITGGSTVMLDGSGYPSGYNNSELAGSVIQSGDVRLICEKLTERPVEGWTCTVDDQDYRVEAVQPIRRSGADIIYICQLRK